MRTKPYQFPRIRSSLLKVYPLSSPSVSTLNLEGTREYNLITYIRPYNCTLASGTGGGDGLKYFSLRNCNASQTLLGTTVTQTSFLPRRKAASNVANS